MLPTKPYCIFIEREVATETASGLNCSVDKRLEVAEFTSRDEWEKRIRELTMSRVSFKAAICQYAGVEISISVLDKPFSAPTFRRPGD